MYGHDLWVMVVAFSLLLTGITILLTTGLQVFVHRRLRFTESCEKTTNTPFVSVLRPIKGADRELENNLRALLQQDYDHYEVIVGIADPSDPAVMVVRALMRERVGGRLKLVTGAPDLGANPKVNNLRHMVRFAQHSTVLISDADVRPARTYLSTIVAELVQSDAALVHNLIVSRGQQSLGAVLEAAQMNLFVTGAVAGADALLGRQCVIGKSMLLRLERFEAVGGWPAIAEVLAEDYVTGSRLQAAGYRVLLSRHVLETVNPDRSLSSFVNRHLRWAQMRRQLGPVAFFFEPLAAPYVWAGLACALATLSGQEGLMTLTFAYIGPLILLRLATDQWLNTRLLGRKASILPVLCAPLKDAFILGVWVTACFRRRVHWRGTRMWIGPQSMVTPIRAWSDSGWSQTFTRALRATASRTRTPRAIDRARVRTYV